MSKYISVVQRFNWQRPFASGYFRSAASYLGLKLAIFTLAGLATQYLLTHYLAKGDYGLLVWVGTIIALLGPFGLPGISTSITGAVAKGYDGNFRRGTWLEMIGGTLGGLVLLGVAGYYWFWAHEETKALIFVVAGVLGSGLWLDTHQSYWNGKKNFKALFWWAVPIRLLQLIATGIVLLYFSLNPLWIFCVQKVIQVTGNVGAAIGILKFNRINKRISKEFASYGWFSNYLYIAGVVTSQIDKLVIGSFLGIEKLAVFAVGELIYVYLFKTPKNLLDQIFIPRLSTMKLSDAAKWIRQRQPYLIILIFLLLIIVAILLPTTYRIIFSAKYDESVNYAYLFLINILVSSPILLVGALIRAHGLKKEAGIAQIIISGVPLILILPFIYFFGLKGVIFTRISQNILLSVYCHRILNENSKM